MADGVLHQLQLEAARYYGAARRAHEREDWELAELMQLKASTLSSLGRTLGKYVEPKYRIESLLVM